MNPLEAYCPTCGASGAEPCTRGRYGSAVWEQGKLMPHPHDSRVTNQLRIDARKAQ